MRIPILISVVFACFIANAQNYAKKLVPLPELLTICHFGAEHKQSRDTIAYLDTGVANLFFRHIAKSVSPSRVVLVTESNIFRGDTDEILDEKNVHCTWITSEIEQMGFTKWVEADNRGIFFTSNYNLFYHCSNYLREFLKNNFWLKYMPDSTDRLGFPIITIYPKKEFRLRQSEIDSLHIALSVVVATNHQMETNMVRICKILKEKGYIPIIVCGFAHIISINEPCLISQDQSDIHNNNLIETSNYIKGVDALNDYFIKNLKK